MTSRTYTVLELAENMHAVARQLGHAPSVSEFRRLGRLPTETAYYNAYRGLRWGQIVAILLGGSIEAPLCP